MNGDPAYDARTTKRAVALLTSAVPSAAGRVELDQRVRVPIGAGFGSSAASATSAVYALGAAARARVSKKDLAWLAYRAETEEETGLGTVSVVYDHSGAGAITSPGGPGEATFVRARVPKGTRVVTGTMGPFDKRGALSSPSVGQRVNELGRDALGAFLADPTLDCLAAQGERFSGRLGLETPEVKKLEARAKSAGALHASQNMIGYAVHCIADESSAPRVSRALRGVGAGVRVDVFDVGTSSAAVLGPSRR